MEDMSMYQKTKFANEKSKQKKLIKLIEDGKHELVLFEVPKNVRHITWFCLIFDKIYSVFEKLTAFICSYWLMINLVQQRYSRQIWIFRSWCT